MLTVTEETGLSWLAELDGRPLFTLGRLDDLALPELGEGEHAYRVEDGRALPAPITLAEWVTLGEWDVSDLDGEALRRQAVERAAAGDVDAVEDADA